MIARLCDILSQLITVVVHGAVRAVVRRWE